MKTLWLKFAEDSSLPARMDDKARAQFDAIFDAGSGNSLWSQAVKRLGISYTPSWQRLIYWHSNTPYINWSYLVRTISAGIVTVRPNDGNFKYDVSYRVSYIMKLIRSQWAIARYILNRLEPAFVLPTKPEDAIAESIALGLALLALTMRLPAHTPEKMAGWLADPSSARPSSLRHTLKQMQGLQQLRTRLSPAWGQLFPDNSNAAHENATEFFWDEPPAKTAQAMENADDKLWKGLPVAGGKITALVLFVPRVKDAVIASGHKPCVLVFPLARPETVELFEHADAVLFGEGGVMSHACTIAREMNLPCITGLGKGFISRMKAHEGEAVWLDIDPASGIVEIASV